MIRQLKAAGHTVTVLGDPVTEREVRAVGVTDFRPWVDAPHHLTRDVADDYTRDWELRSPIDAVAASFTLLGSLMAAEARAARPAAPRWKPSRCVAASCRPRSGRRGRST